MIREVIAPSLCKRRWAAGAIGWIVLAVGGGPVIAQVVLDGSFGTSGAVTGPNFSITDGVGATRGNNLFHSFAQFDLKAGDVAAFSGPANIQNILARVTGGSASSINGTIRSSIVGANFFLINPCGIVFGPNAAVNVTGSFAATTANYLRLSDGAQFVAALDADDSGLSTAPVSAFGFLGANHGNIVSQKTTLRVSNGKSVTLVGGDVTLTGGAVQAPAGQLNVVSVQSAGEVTANPGATTVAEFNSAFPEQGRINLQGGVQLDASGTGGGRIVIRGGQLVVDGSKIQANTTSTGTGQGVDISALNELDVVNGGQINSLSVTGRGAGGNVNLSAQTIRLDGGGLVDLNGNPVTQISTASGDASLGGGTAKGGDIVIRAGSLELANSAQITSATGGAGNAGRIDITADSVRLEGASQKITQIAANTWFGGGKAGDIVIHSDTLDMLNGATILGFSAGSGQAGLIDLTAQSISILSGAVIAASAFGQGPGGDIHITADSLRIDGQNRLTGIQAVTTSSSFPAPGGNIQIQAGTVELLNLGSIFATSYGLGPGGNIEVNAGNLTMAANSTIRAESYDIGSAGKVALHAGENVLLSGNSEVSTSAPGSSGGDISVVAGSQVVLENSQITAAAGLNGGNIEVSAPNLVYLLHSTLTAAADTTGSGSGNGGNLTIDPSFLILNESALVSKSSFGNGGNITILTDYFLQSSSLIDASAPFGLPGTVSVSAPQVDLSGSLVGLAANLLDAESLLRPDCAVRLMGGASSFVLLGRGGLPLVPGGFVPSGMVTPQ